MRYLALIAIFPLAFMLAPGPAAQADQLDEDYPVVDRDFHVVPEACRGDNAAEDCGYEEFIELIRNVVALLLYFAIFIATLMFVYAGIIYLTNSGNPTRIAQAKSIMWNTIIGLVIAFAAYLIVAVIVSTLGVCEDFNPFTDISTSC